MSGIETVSFPAGAGIFKEGDKPDGVYFIISGGVEVFRNEGGTKVILAKLAPDAVFGEMALIDNQPRSANVSATVATECMKGTTENFNALLSSVDSEVRQAMQSIVSVIRSKNKAKKINMSPADVAELNSLKQKSEQIKQQIMSNPALLDKIKKLNPFINGVFNSLLKLLMS